MKAVRWHGIGDIRLDDVPEPKIEEPYDAIVEITTSAICGTDLHFVRGTMPDLRDGQILGHEAVGVVRDLGPAVRNFQPGDRVVIASTIGCGACSYCRAGYYAQCDNANPNGPQAGTAFFGGPRPTGAFDGLQAEFARIPYAHVGMVALPESVDDQQAIMLSDIMPTAWFGARLAEVSDGDTVAILGAGPVGQCAIPSARKLGAGRIIVVDGVPDRLSLARDQHAEIVNFNDEDPVEAIRDLTEGIGVDRVIDAVGVDAQGPKEGPAADALADQLDGFAAERAAIAPDQNPDGRTWVPGDAPSLATRWAVDVVAKAGTVGVVGVYPPTVEAFPFGMAMNKNLSVNMGNCNHRRYLPRLIDEVASGALDTAPLVTRWTETTDVIEAYERFDRREAGWTKVAIGVSDGGIAPGMGTASGTGAGTTAGTESRAM